LGTTWDTEEDEFIFSNPPINRDGPFTKRTVLGTMAGRHFDATGLLCPLMVGARSFFQQLCLSGVGWNEQLDSEKERQWMSILDEWEGSEIRVRRRAGVTKFPSMFTPSPPGAIHGKTYQLHVFADASGSTYAAAAYLRSRNAVETEVHLLFRVKPIEFCRREGDRDFTPRLELLAVELACKVLTSFREELRATTSDDHIWTDSTCTLGWLNNLERKEVFVENRVRKIRNTPNVMIKHVRSEDNPADLATRGLNVQGLVKAGLWWEGPEWLWDPERFWPEEIPGISIYDTRNPPPVPQLPPLAIPPAGVVAAVKGLAPDEWEQLLRNQYQSSQITGIPTAEQRHQAVKELIKEAQREMDLPDSPNLRPFTDDEGLIRVSGRLQNADIGEDRKNPILLPREARLTRMIILDTHVRLNHAGVAITLERGVLGTTGQETRKQRDTALRGV